MKHADSKYNITIVGAGNSGMAHAFVLSKLGHDVTILKTSNAMHDENFKAVSRNGGIYCIDQTAPSPVGEFAPIKCITRNDAEAFAEAQIVLVLTQSLQHEAVAKRILPYIQNIEALLVVPGNMGSVFFRRGLPSSVIVAEGESTIIDARIGQPGEVEILFRNVRNALSFNPMSDAKHGFDFFHSLLPDNYTHLRANIVETALNNPNLVVHTVGTVLSASRIEYSKGEFWLYREGFTPSIWRVINKLDAERMAVINAYGGHGEPYVECCKFRNERSLDVDAMEVFNHYAQHGSPKGPSTINNRFLTEDIPNGLCLLSALGHMAGIATPTADALAAIAGALLDKDFTSVARTPGRLGFADAQQLIDYCNDK